MVLESGGRVLGMRASEPVSLCKMAAWRPVFWEYGMSWFGFEGGMY